MTKRSSLKIISMCILMAVSQQVNAQFAVKHNLLYDAAGLTPNLGIEVGTGKKQTAQLFYGLNPWEFSDDKQMKHWCLMPEYRWWFCHKFSGSFVGVHGLGGEFNASNIDLPLGLWDELKDHRIEGWYIGGGLTYGYQWVMSKHWNFEASIGAGFIHFDYDQFNCGKCGEKDHSGDKNYWGVTKAALSFLYLF